MFVGVIYFIGSLCYTGPWLLSLPLVCIFGLFRVFGGCVFVVMSLFLLICLLFAPIAYHVYHLTYCVLVSDGPFFCFEIGSWCLAAILFDLIWCSLVYRGRGVPC